MSGKHIDLFLVDGTPGGLTTAEIVNWTGHVLSARRSDMSVLTNRRELSGTCVYLLLGEDEDGAARAYIGETDDFVARLRNHNANKDFWDRVVVVTSKDANLTKAHGRYLESKLISLAKQAGRVALENGTEPSVPALPEADASDMDYFIGQLQIILPVLGVNAIRVRETKPAPAPSAEAQVSPVFTLANKKHGIEAQAQQIDGEFTVLAGSTVAAKVRESEGYSETTARAYASYAALHQRLVADGSILIDGSIGRVTRDIVFSSPSTAGAIVEGRSCNGRIAWVSNEGSFGQWESRGVE